jgi:hypothetical protein
MRRVGLLLFATLSVVLSCLRLEPARATGVYEDAVGLAGFVFAPHRGALRAAIIRTNDDHRDASVFAVAGRYPLRDNLLIQVDVPFVSLAVPSSIRTGFGDPCLRARLRVWGGDRRVLHALGGIRVGTGTTRVYPYASQSYDFDLAVGYVDTLEVLDLWAMVGGVVVKREPEGLEEDDRHENFARAGGGLGLPFGSAISLRLGANALLFRSGRVRELYFAQLQYRYSPSLELRVSTHAEAGEPAERVSDLAITAAVHTLF